MILMETESMMTLILVQTRHWVQPLMLQVVQTVNWMMTMMVYQMQTTSVLTQHLGQQLTLMDVVQSN